MKQLELSAKGVCLSNALIEEELLWGMTAHTRVPDREVASLEYMSSRPNWSVFVFLVFLKFLKVFCVRHCHKHLTPTINGMLLSSHKIDATIIFALLVVRET